MAIKAIVIKTYGDPAWTRPMADTVARVIEMDSESISAVRAECDRLRAMQEIRSYADTVRLDAACKALDVKYPAEEHGRVYGAIIGVWGLLWYCIYCAYDYLSEWNREPNKRTKAKC